METFPLGELAGPVLWALAKARVAQWDRIAKSPRLLRRAQERALRASCRDAARSSFGRAHALESVSGHADLQTRVPLRGYDDYAPYIARLLEGERDVLVPGVVPFLGLSSGSTRTTNEKMLPITCRQLAWQRRQAFDVVARYLAMTNDRSFPGGFTLGFLPPPIIEQRGAVGITNNPALMQLHMPRLSRPVSLPRSPIREIADQDERMRRMVDAYLDHDVRALAGTTCWFPAIMDRVLETARARGRDVSTVRDVWPNLRALFGGGVRTTSYRALVDARAGAPLTLVDTYNATEGGCFAISDRGDDDALLVLPDRGVFFEFIPLAELDRPTPTRVPLWRVEPGVDYAVALTTPSGLFGYLVGDVVRFESVFPHRVVFSGRVGAELSIAHEATSVRQVEDAMRSAADAHGITLAEYAVTAEHVRSARAVSRYVIFAELEGPARSSSDLTALARSFDEALKQENWLYRIHRASDVALVAPVVVPLPRGAAHRFARAVGRAGPQQKFPRIVPPGSREAEALAATTEAPSVQR